MTLTVGIEHSATELAGPERRAADFTAHLEDWEDLLRLLVDPEHPRVAERERKRRLLSFLLQRVALDEERFWKLSRGQRGRLFLSRYSRQSHDVPRLELTSFDLDKVSKERYRTEPLTLGAAWHFGFWRSYFSHAAITHPANDGLREEFSTAWDLARRLPAVLFRSADETRLQPIRKLRIDMPMIVGPLPYSDGVTLERAYLRAAERADPLQDRKTATLVVVEADALLEHGRALLPHAAHVMPRLAPRHVQLLEQGGGAPGAGLGTWLGAVRIVELVWSDDLPRAALRLHEQHPELLFSVYLPFADFRTEAAFFAALERAVRTDGVAAVHVQSGARKSYELIPRIDQHLKRRFLRARVQLVNAGGDTDTQASAATVYESVLLGANGGALTHLAALALVPELVEVLKGADPAPVTLGLARRDADELARLAENTLTCWQHSILDFLSCMGIDDIKKTSGNTMAITMTRDWMRDIDRLATDEFGERNRELNAKRVADEPIPRAVRERYLVSALLDELMPDLPMAHAARVLAHEGASWHLMNTNRNLTADFLEVIYRMSAGSLPELDDFFVVGDMGLGSLDEVQVHLSRESVAWSLERLQRDPELLDYISLAIARGFLRPGAATPKAPVRLVRELPSEEASEDVVAEVLVSLTADPEGGFDVGFEAELEAGGASLWLEVDAEGETTRVELTAENHGGRGLSVLRASADGATVVRRDPRAPESGLRLSGLGVRRPIWQGPVGHASISLGSASEDFLRERIRGNAGLTFTSSGEGGPLRLESDEEMAWESLQAASGHFGLHGTDLRRVRDVEIKINQGAKPGKGGRLAGHKVTETVSRARNIPVGTDALSPDPKHDIYSIEDMPAEVWLWLLYHNYCGIKISGSNYTKYVAAGMWSNFVVDYLLIDGGIGGSGNYHADSSHVGWPDIFRTILHTHHALVNERVDLEGSGVLRPLRDANGIPFGAKGGTRLLASGGLRSELDMLKVFLAGADGVVEASIGKAVAFGCNQCGNCHLDCPRGGITTKPELTQQNDPETMRRRFRNWTVVNMVKLAVLIDALNRESGALDEAGRVVDRDALIDDIRKLRGRTDLLTMPTHAAADDGRASEPPPPEVERDSCRVGSLAVTEPVTVHAIWESARVSHNGGNNRGGGIDFAGFAPAAVREHTAMFFNTIGPDRVETMQAMLLHLDGCRFYDALGRELDAADVRADVGRFRLPVRPEFDSEEGWRKAGLREHVGDYYLFFVKLKDDVLPRYGAKLLASEHWLQRETKYGDLAERTLLAALREGAAAAAAGAASPDAPAETLLPETRRLAAFLVDVREEYFSALSHLLDTRYYRTHPEPDYDPARRPQGGTKYSPKRRGYLVSIGEDLGAVKISGWTHTIPAYFDFERFWIRYPGAAEQGGVDVKLHGRLVRTPELHAHVWGMHHRYPTNSPSIDAEGRGNPAGAHPFKAYNVLLMHNGEQVGVDSTAPFLCEYGYVHADAESMGAGAELYEGDSLYERKALTDTEYAAYLVDFTRRVLGLTTEEASQIISPITGIDLEAMDEDRREKLRLLMENYVQLTPTGPYKFTIVESLVRNGERVVGFRENMDIKFLRPHEIVSHRDLSPGGAEAVANGSEAKIADAMLRILHQRGVLKDPAADLRFNMRQGGKPGLEEHGGVFEAFVVGGQELLLVNRFGEVVPVKRAGFRVDRAVSLERVVRQADLHWMQLADDLVDGLVRDAGVPASGESRRAFGPSDELPPLAGALLETTLEHARALSFHDYRYLVESALPRAARLGDGECALALRVLTELRKRLAFTDLGGKSLASMEYLTDGGRDAEGRAEGGLYRILSGVPHLTEASGTSRHVRISHATRHDLLGPADPLRDVLVVDLNGFESESFTLESCSRFLSEAVLAGWRNLIGFDARGGPRYMGTNFGLPGGAPARDVVLELYGRELGDFPGALLEGGRIYQYGQAQSHVGFKADSGYLFVLQDALNTCMYSAHGATFSVWDSGSRFAVAGQNKVFLADGKTSAQGFKSIHFGSPNEYAFEYLMSGGPNSLHVVLGLHKPDTRGELALRPKPYAGKFLMSGAAAGRVFLLDPERRLDPEQYLGNVPVPIEPDEWTRQVGPFLTSEARRRGVPLRIVGESFSLRLGGTWKTWHYAEAFVKLMAAKELAAAEQRKLVLSGAKT